MKFKVKRLEGRILVTLDQVVIIHSERQSNGGYLPRIHGLNLMYWWIDKYFEKSLYAMSLNWGDFNDIALHQKYGNWRNAYRSLDDFQNN